MFTIIFKIIKRRISEPSTWAGIGLVASAFGLNFTPEQVQALTIIGTALAGLPDKQHL